jgi:hypothetical protein
MGEIFNVSRKVIGMTATLINGYSSGIFHLLYRTMPHRMLKDGKPYHAPREFDAEYGVVENVYESTDADYASNRRAQKVKKMTRQLPGVSPLVFSRFLLEHAAFLSLSDMGKDLPDYEEIPVPLHMPEAVEAEYKRVESVLKKVLREDRKAAKKILSAYLNCSRFSRISPTASPRSASPVRRYARRAAEHYRRRYAWAKGREGAGNRPGQNPKGRKGSDLLQLDADGQPGQAPKAAHAKRLPHRRHDREGQAGQAGGMG